MPAQVLFSSAIGVRGWPKKDLSLRENADRKSCPNGHTEGGGPGESYGLQGRAVGEKKARTRATQIE